MNEKPVKLAIIGGGAAGMFAAAVAAERRIPCVLIERKARLGSKVLMTANGRCNFTKDISPDQFLADLDCGCGGKTSPSRQECRVPFVAEAIRECPPRKIIAGLQALKVPLRRMPDGRMFPADGKAATIVHAFGDLLRDAEVPILTNCPVLSIEKLNNRKAENPRGAQLKGDATFLSRENKTSPTASPRFLIRTANFDLLAENVLLATGGVSYPKTGSVGDGQNFAKSLGHRLVPYRPGLIGLETTDPRVTRLAGRRFEDDGRVKVFGPPLVPHALTRSEPQALSDSKKPFGPPLVPHALTRSEPQALSDSGRQLLFDYRGEVDCERFGLSGAAIYNAQRFIEHYKRQASTSTSTSTSDLSLEVWFGHNRLQFSNLRPRPVKEAIVTIGGVDTDEIDPHTMESRICPGLYFAGEVMDIDGPTGGYNLTLAFATARKAVLAAHGKAIAAANVRPQSPRRG